MSISGRNALWACVGLVATLVFVGVPWLHVDQPLALTGDHLVHVKALREAMDGLWRINDKLGAPWHHDTLYFPLFDFAYTVPARVLSLVTSNVFTVMVLVYALGVSLMFLFSFWAFRALDIPPWLAVIVSAAFVASPFFAFRSYQHANLALYFAVPLGAALPLLFARSKDLRKLLRSPIVIVAVLAAGTSGVYYGAFTCIFLVLGAAMVAMERRDWRPLVAGACLAIFVPVILVATTYGTAVFGFLDGSTPAPPARGGAWAQMYHGLSLSNAMWDYFRIGLWTTNLADYQNALAIQIKDHGESFAPEWPGAFLTTIILGSVVAAPLLPFVKPGERSESYLLLLMSVLFIAFGVVFALRGGLGYVFNYMITPGIRAQERILPFLQFYALAAVCMTWKLLLSDRDGLRPYFAMTLIVCLVPGIKAAYQVLPRKQEENLSNPSVTANYYSIQAMLAAKDAAGLKTILQFPVVFWPESPNVVGLVPYEHLLPYLLDRHGSPTRWSYGLHWYQSGFQQIRAEMRVDNPQIAARARAIGYDGILIERAGLTPVEQDALSKNLRDAGAEIVFDDARRALIRLSHTRTSSSTFAP